MTLNEIIEEGGTEAYRFGDTIIYRVPIYIAYYDSLGIPKDKDGWDITRSYKYVMINE